MKTLVLAIAGLGFGLVLTSAPVAGGEKDKKGANQQESPKNVQTSATSKALRDLEVAELLLQFGRREKHAESLLVAAQILHKTQTKALNVERVASQPKETLNVPAKDNSPKAIVAEAAKLSSAPHVVALVDATGKLIQEDVRGATGGPKVDSFIIQPGQVMNWNPITFRAGEQAEVYVSNGIVGRMSLQIFDDAGNLVVQDSQPGNYFRCVWVPRWTGEFRMRLINNDTVAFRCGLATN